MEALAWHMHGLPMVRYRNLVYLEEDPQNESGIDWPPPSMTDSGGFPPGTPVSTHQSRVVKKISRVIFQYKRENMNIKENIKREQIEK